MNACPSILKGTLSGLALALMLGTGPGAGSALAQTILEIGGAGTIGTTSLPTTLGVAKVPNSGSNWKAAGGNGNTFSSLTSPSVLVGASGEVTLTFTHRYNFEETWDGGAVYVSVNGGAATKVPLASFTSNGYNGTATNSVWALGDEIFTGQSAGWGTPALISSVASLGALTAGDTVTVEFRGGWDGNTFPASPNWEIGTVSIADTAATLLNANFTVDGASGFTATTSGTGSSPWTYAKPVSRFELDAATDTSDRYAPDVQGSVIDLNGAKIEVVLLNGTLQANDSFTLFDLSGGSTLSGSIGSISLPALGTWDTTNLATTGVIVFVAPYPSLTWNVGTGTWDTVTANWTGDSTLFVNDGNTKVAFNNPSGGAVTVVGMTPSSTTVDSAGNYSFITGGTAGAASILGGSLSKSGSGTLQLGDSGLTTGNTYRNGFSSVKVNAGTLSYGNQNALGTGAVTLEDGVTLLKFAQEGNGAGLAVANNFVLNGQATLRTVFSGFKDQWFSGVFSGTGSLRITGERRAVTLTGNNTFSGGVTMENYEGTGSTAPYNLDIGHLNALGTGTLTVKTVYLASVTQFRGLGATVSLSADPGIPNNIVIASGATFSAGRGQNMRLEGVISGPGALRKRNTSTLILDGASTYTGGTTVEAGGGTLTLNGSLADASMSILGGTVNGTGTLTFNINDTTADQIILSGGALDITALNVVINPSGPGLTQNTYVLVNRTGGTITGTAFASVTGATGYTVDYNYGGGTQIALVKILAGYAGWSGGAAADADANGDGVSNGVAWALGAANPSANAVSLLPALDTTSDPAYLIFTFNRSDAAKDDPNTSITVQYGSDLSGWTTAVHDGDNVIITETPGSPTDAVQVKLKRSTLQAGARLFARLKVAVTGP